MSPSRRLPGAWKKSIYLENDARLRHSYYGMRIGNRTQAFECSVGSWIFERGWRVSSAIGARIEGWVWGGGVPLATGMGMILIYLLWKSYMLSCSDTTAACDGQTNRRTNILQSCEIIVRLCVTSRGENGSLLTTIIWCKFARCKFQKNLTSNINKNLAITNRSRISCTHNMPRASMITPWPWNLG